MLVHVGDDVSGHEGATVVLAFHLAAAVTLRGG